MSETRVPTHKDGWTYVRIEGRVLGRDGSSYRAVCSVHGPVGPWTWPRSKANDHRLRHIGEHERVSVTNEQETE